jgi:hypothetical protein
MSESVTQVERSGFASRERGIEYDNTVICRVVSIVYRIGRVSQEASTRTGGKAEYWMSDVIWNILSDNKPNYVNVQVLPGTLSESGLHGSLQGTIRTYIVEPVSISGTTNVC